jgi:hypothetical protein
MKKTIKFSLDTDQSAPLSKAQKASLKALAAMSDKEIDFSDAHIDSNLFELPNARLGGGNLRSEH